MVQVLTRDFDPSMLKNIYINKNNVEQHVNEVLKNNQITDRQNFNQWLYKAISVTDLTTLSGDDTESNVIRLCLEAMNPLFPDTVKRLGIIEEKKLRTAAVCVYPNRVEDAHNAIKRMGLLNEIQIASVATGFPSGLYPLSTRLQEIKYCISKGATEIDVVIDRSLVLSGKWKTLFEEIQHMRKECGDKVHLKVILGVGELGTLENVYKASMVAMMAGADFIKTSTGKEAVNATLPVGVVMCRAIRNFYMKTGVKVGLKPAGGLKTPRDAVNWLVMVRTELGPEWLCPELFRIGASSLLTTIQKYLFDQI